MNNQKIKRGLIFYVIFFSFIFITNFQVIAEQTNSSRLEGFLDYVQSNIDPIDYITLKKLSVAYFRLGQVEKALALQKLDGNLNFFPLLLNCMDVIDAKSYEKLFVFLDREASQLLIAENKYHVQLYLCCLPGILVYPLRQGSS